MVEVFGQICVEQLLAITYTVYKLIIGCWTSKIAAVFTTIQCTTNTLLSLPITQGKNASLHDHIAFNNNMGPNLYSSDIWKPFMIVKFFIQWNLS